MSKDYYRKWYQKNKEKLNEKRRLKYSNDSLYREKQKAMSKRLYKKKMGEPVSYKPKACKVVVFDKKDGTEVRLKVYTVSKLAATLGVTVQTIRNWESNGKIPLTPIRIGKWRLYSQPMINAVVSAYKRRGNFSSKEIKGKTMFDDVSQSWDKIVDGFDFENGGRYE